MHSQGPTKLSGYELGGTRPEKVIGIRPFRDSDHMAVSSFFCCAEIEDACSQIELQAPGGFATVLPRKPSVLLQQLHSSTTPEKKPKTHLDDIEEEQSAGLLSPPRSRRPLPGFHVRCTSQTDSSPAKPPSEVIRARSVHRVEEVCDLAGNRRADDLRRKAETCEVGCQTVAAKPPEVTGTVSVHGIEGVSDLAENHGVDDQRRKAEACGIHSQIAAATPSEVTGTRGVRRSEEVCNLAENRRVDELCRKTMTCGADSHAAENASKLIQNTTPADHSDCLEETRCDDLGAGVAANVFEADAAAGCIGALDMDAIADQACSDANGETRRERCSSSNSTHHEEWYIGDVSADAANDAAGDNAHDGTLSDTVLSHAALGQILQVQKEPTDEHPGAYSDAAVAGGACKPLLETASRVESVAVKLEGQATAKPAHTISAPCNAPYQATVPAFEPAHTISAPCRALCSKANEGMSTSCGEAVSDFTPLLDDTVLQRSLQSANAGFAAYYWKDGIGEREISGSSDASCQADGDGGDGSTPLTRSMAWPVPEDTEESEEEAANSTTLPMVEVLNCVPSRKFGTLLRLWDRRCNSYQSAEDNP